jgi:WD40 repeat protein
LTGEAAYSPDGETIVSGSSDQTVRVWDTKTGVEVYQLVGHTDPVYAVAYSPDGTRIVSGSADQTIQQWYVDVEYLLDLADSLIQRDPPIFVGGERALYGFDAWPARAH